MNFRPYIFAGLLISLVPGCVINQEEQRSVMQQQREENLMLQEDLRRMRARLDALEEDMQLLNQRVNASTDDQSRALQSQLQGFNTTLDDLQKRIRSVDAAREQDKKEIIDQLSRDIANVLRKQQSSRPAAATPTRSTKISNEGYEHVVQQGETLSAIAKAYGASSADIMAANNLQSADMLRVGQKLFIPAQ